MGINDAVVPFQTGYIRGGYCSRKLAYLSFIWSVADIEGAHHTCPFVKIEYFQQDRFLGWVVEETVVGRSTWEPAWQQATVR